MSSSRALALILAWAAASAAACGFVTSGLPDAGAGSGGGGSGSGAGPTTASTGGHGGHGGHGGSPATCATSSCEALPEGWDLVRARWIDPSLPDDASTPTCAGGSPAIVYFHDPPAAACTPCACGQPVGASCTAPEITCSWSTLDCSTSDLQVQESSGGCNFHLPPPGSNSNGSCKLTAPGKLTPGTCDASGGDVTPTEIWAGKVAVCPQTPQEAGCGAGQSCLPTGSTADGAVCITRGDSSDCPAGWAAQTTVAFESGVDQRACSACGCKVACQGGDYVAYDDDLCNDSNHVSVSSTTCTQIPHLFDWSQSSLDGHTATPALASCDGATPKGQIETTGPHRICCR